MSGYQVKNLSQTLDKAKAAGVGSIAPLVTTGSSFPPLGDRKSQ
jgi:hypothetical protein